MELAKKPNTAQPGDAALGHNHSRRRSFFFLGEEGPFGKAPALVSREEVFSQYRCFQSPGRWSSLRSIPRMMSTEGRNARFSHKTQNHQHGQFWAAWLRSQPQVLSGETCKCWRRWGLRAPTRGEPVQGAGGTAPCCHAAGRVQAGNLVHEGTASAWPHLRVLTVKASVH